VPSGGALAPEVLWSLDLFPGPRWSYGRRSTEVSGLEVQTLRALGEVLRG